MAENRQEAGGEDVGCTTAWTPGLSGLSACCRGNSASSLCALVGLHAATLLRAWCSAGGHQSLLPRVSRPACVLLANVLCCHFGGDHPKTLYFPPPDDAPCPAAGAYARWASRARTATLPATPAGNTAVRTGAPACLVPPTTPACALPATQVGCYTPAWQGDVPSASLFPLMNANSFSACCPSAHHHSLWDQPPEVWVHLAESPSPGVSSLPVWGKSCLQQSPAPMAV